jgi:hypothetical protein
MVPMVSLERSTAALRFKEIKANGAGFRALSANTVADGLFGILWHERLQFRLGPFMLQKGLPGAAKRPANSVQEFEPLISTTRIASILGFGGSTPNR